MNKRVLRDKLMKEIEALPQDKIGELYDIIHHFRLGLGLEEKERQGTKRKAKDFFGIWRDITPEESRVLEEIKLRRERTLRERNLALGYQLKQI